MLAHSCYYRDMAELFISKRVKFSAGKQREFLEKSRKSLNLTNSDLAKFLKISSRTLSDWKRGKYHMPFKAVKLLSQKTGRKLPKNIKILESFWYANKGARKGGLNCYKKYGIIGGDPDRRKEKWFEWWEQEGKFKKDTILNSPLPIKKPKRSEELAEFVGIVLGDGGISQRQVTVTLHSKDDKEYSRFVMKLIEKLFQVTPGIYEDIESSVNDIVVSRTELVKFCTHNLGLKIGNKVRQQVDIPLWVKSSKKFGIACVRGLIDTDGSIFNHKYKVGKKYYSYKKLFFTSLSRPLAASVHEILNKLGIKSRLAKDKDVCLDSISSVQKYFKVIGTHNLKHLKRYKL